MTASVPPPSLDLARRVCAGFVRQGLTMSGWSEAHGLARSSARQALIGTWNGPKGRAWRARLVRAARIEYIA